VTYRAVLYSIANSYCC